MRTVGFRWQGYYAGRVIDVTPIPWWRRAVRKFVIGLGWIVAMPLLLLLGGMLLLLAAGGVGAILLLGWLQYGRFVRHGRPRRAADSFDVP